jgi:hypothetical protein
MVLPFSFPKAKYSSLEYYGRKTYNMNMKNGFLMTWKLENTVPEGR